MVWIGPTLDNDLDDGHHVGGQLNDRTNDDRNPYLLVTCRKASQKEPHHSGA